jgi:hypothetical protein
LQNWTIKQTDWTSPPPEKVLHKNVTELVIEGFEGGPLRFKYDFNLVCDLETETGLNLNFGLSLSQLNARQTRALICAFLRTAHAVTLEEVGDLLTSDRTAILAAWTQALVVSKMMVEEKPEEPTPSAQTASPAA